MQHFPRWKQLLILAIVLVSTWVAAANVVPDSWRESGYFPQKTIKLGLDLQGGSYLLLEVQSDIYFKEQLEQVQEDIRTTLREKKEDGTRITYSALRSDGEKVTFRLANPEDMDLVEERLSRMKRDMEIVTQADGAVELAYRESAKKQLLSDLLNQSIEIVRRRVDETGTREPLIQKQGGNRILLQVPGLESPDHLKELMGRTAKMTFHLMDEANPFPTPGQQAMIGTKILGDERASGRLYMIKNRSVLTGDMLSDARPAYDQYGSPAVSFRFNTAGARKFADITKENVGKPFAIVLDNKVVTAPVIQTPILQGSGEITGNFTVQEAGDLAVLLRAGALPAPLHVLEERSVGPSLGQDSIAAGKKAALIGVSLVLAMMLVCYMLFGLFANIALMINLVLIVAALSLFEATLTMPGIAGLVLTLGMAVDANILIFERIREEIINGRTPFSAIESGFNMAFGTILDSNITTLITTTLLFIYGSGPIKGFAVTLSIGILASMFTAVLLTRLMIVAWLHYKRPNTLPL